MKLKNLLITLFLLGAVTDAVACDVCRESQPKALQGITHGTGAQADTDYLIIGTAVVVVSATLFLSVRFLSRPERNCPGHIKNIVIE